MRPSTSICTPRAFPSSGRNSEYGKPEPTIRSVSQPCIRSQLGRVPSSPIDPVTKGRSSGTAALPRSALATPAPSISATSMTSCAAFRAPAPTSIATRSPALSTSAARCSSCSPGTTRGGLYPAAECTLPCEWGGTGTAASICRSLGTMTAVTVRSASAIRMARSIRCLICAASVAICTNSCATSLNSVCRSTSCW